MVDDPAKDSAAENATSIAGTASEEDALGFATFRPSVCKEGTDDLDYEKAVGFAINTITGVLDPGLNISSLQRTTVSSTYSKAVAEAARELGLGVVTPTERAEGSGMAIVLPDVTRDILVIHAGLIASLFERDITRQAIAWRTLHHELAHVDDNQRKRPMLAGVRFPRREGATFVFADSLWSEYQAERRAHPTFPPTHPLHLQMLVDILNTVSHGPGSGTVDADWFATVLKYCGYVLGTLAGSKTTLQDHEGASATAIGASLLGPEWTNLESALDGLYSSRGQWSGIEAYGPLMGIVERLRGVTGI